MIKKLANKGFTLTELMVVVFILGILAAISVPHYLTNVEITRAREAITFARQWQGARDVYFAENGHMPNRTSLDIIDLDQANAGEGDLAVYDITYFFIDPVDTSTIVFKRRSMPYLIYATDDNLFCCWENDDTQYQKLCDNLVSGNTEQTTGFNFRQANYTCYTFSETD